MDRTSDQPHVKMSYLNFYSPVFKNKFRALNTLLINAEYIKTRKMNFVPLPKNLKNGNSDIPSPPKLRCML
jgi:hypothetical protein